MGEYHDMAMDVMRQAERDGIRTMSGHHMRPIESQYDRDAARWDCGCCMDQGCDFCNEVPDGD